MDGSDSDSCVVADLGLVIAAGGSSSRFGDGNKLLADLGGMPVFIWSIRELARFTPPGMIVLSCQERDAEAFKDALSWHLPEVEVKTVIGGATRTSSVLNALRALPAEAKLAAVHDAARPFVRGALLLSCVEACRVHGGAVAAKRVTDTVKEADPSGVVVRTLDRERLWCMETPQVFSKELLIDACGKAIETDYAATDDASAMERFHPEIKVKLVETALFNMKLTYHADLDIARERMPALRS